MGKGKKSKIPDTTLLFCACFLILVRLPRNKENNYSQFGEGDGKSHPQYLLRFDHILTVLLSLLVFGCIGAGQLRDIPCSPASVTKLLLVLAPGFPLQVVRVRKAGKRV